ncbi:hypothetical protein L9F63_013739, partial [Diploptera punctata]
ANSRQNHLSILTIFRGAMGYVFRLEELLAQLFVCRLSDYSSEFGFCNINICIKGEQKMDGIHYNSHPGHRGLRKIGNRKQRFIIQHGIRQENSDSVKNLNIAGIALVYMTEMDKALNKVARHVVVELSPQLRIEVLRKQKVKLHWNMCK